MSDRDQFISESVPRALSARVASEHHRDDAIDVGVCLDIFLDGELVDRCLEYDIERGYVVTLLPADDGDVARSAYGHLIERIATGRVEVRRRGKPIRRPTLPRFRPCSG